MNLTRNQILSITIAVLSVMIGSTAQLTDLFGAGVAKTLISVATLANATLSSIMAVLTSQGQTVQDVKAMPGVEKIEVNAQANKSLASLAVDPNEAKITVTPGDITQVTQTASAK